MARIAGSSRREEFFKKVTFYFSTARSRKNRFTVDEL